MHDKLEGAAKRVGKRTVKKSIQGKDHAEKQAMEILEQGRERFGWETVESMRQTHRRGDLERVAIARAAWRATAMPQGWIAERLGLRSAANVSQWLRRFDALEDRTLPKEIKKWKQEMSRIDAPGGTSTAKTEACSAFPTTRALKIPDLAESRPGDGGRLRVP